MPRIPLYNQGQGPTQRLATGQLSQRADVGAFTAPGRALAQFGETAGQIAFNFGMAERNKQDEDAVRESKMKFLQESAEFEKNNPTNNYEEYRDKYGAWKEGWLTRNTQNLGSRRKRLITNQINPVASVESLKGQNKAFRLSEAQGTISMDADNNENINAISIHPPDSVEFISAMNNLDRTYKSNESLGRPLKVATKDLAILKGTSLKFEKKIAEASSFKELNLIQNNIKNDKDLIVEGKTIPFELKQAFYSDINKRKNALSSEIFAQKTDEFTDIDLTYTQTKKLIDSLEKDQDITITTNKGDTFTLKASDYVQKLNDTFIEYFEKKTIDKKNEFLSTQSKSIVDSGNNDGYTGAIDSAKTFHNNHLDKEEADATVLDAVNVYISDAKNSMSLSNDDPANANLNTIEEKLRIAKGLLKESFSNRTALVDKFGSIGNSALSSLDSIVNMESKLVKLKTEKKVLLTATTAMKNGTYSSVKSQLNLEKKQEEKIADKFVKTEPDVNNALLILEKNNLTSPYLSNILENAANDVYSDQPDIENITQKVAFFKNMKVRSEGTDLLTNHLEQTDRETFNTIIALQDTGKEMPAIINILKQIKTKGIKDVNVKYGLVEKQVNTISSESTSFLGVKPKNASEIRNKVQFLTRKYIGLGVAPKIALKQAAEDLLSTHINHKGIFMPRTKNVPQDELIKRADTVIEMYKKDNPDVDIDDLSAQYVNGEVSRWVVWSGNDYPDYNQYYDLVNINQFIKDKAKETKQNIIKTQQEKQEKLRIEQEKDKKIINVGDFISEAEYANIDFGSNAKSIYTGVEKFISASGYEMTKEEAMGLSQDIADIKFGSNIEAKQTKMGKVFTLIPRN